MHSAVLEFSFDSVGSAGRARRSILPDLKKDERDRVGVEVGVCGKKLVIKVEARDVGALRACVNSVVGLVSLIC